MINAVSCVLIAGIYQKPNEAAITVSCGQLNPRNSDKIVDYVTQPLIWSDGRV